MFLKKINFLVFGIFKIFWLDKLDLQHKLLLKTVKFYANPDNWVDRSDKFKKLKITKKDYLTLDLRPNIKAVTRGGAMAYTALYFINNDLTEKGYEF